MSKYSQDAADAAASIKEAGSLVPVRRYLSTFDPVTGAPGVSTYSEVSLPAVVLPVGQNDNFPEGLVLAKARKLLSAPVGLAFMPQPGDVAVFLGANWAVKGAEPLDPDANGVAIILTLYVERAGVT